MSLFFLLFLLMPLIDLAWWRWADGYLRRMQWARWWRIALGLFMVAEIGQFLWLLLARGFAFKVYSPVLLLGSAYLWHLVILPVLAIATLFFVLEQNAWKIARRFGARQKLHAVPPAATALSLPAMSRREFLLASGLLAPPALCLGFTGYGVSQRDNFRINRMELPLRGLPRELDGVTIAHVSDIHLGKFTDERVLRRVVEATNDLRSDMILFTGDLIDFDLSDLSTALDYIRKMDSPQGVVLIEGNHDLFQSRSEFEGKVKQSGVPLLLDEQATIRVRGREVQLLGMKWEGGGKANYPVYRRHLERMGPLRDPEAFQILMAHHPHAFDRAAEFGIPLTLAGHTHGGQLMLTPEIGGGPMLFKYWSGVYRKDDAALLVNNGVGNWFPLRINAPAEIVHLTLRSLS